MDLTATIVLGVSLLGISVLFLVKNWEETNVRIFVPRMRLAADQKALTLKAMIETSKSEFQKMGPTTLRMARTLLHDLALTLAALSRASERQAHRLADMVSHKHRFERRETRSEFLKQVGEFKNVNEAEDSS